MDTYHFLTTNLPWLAATGIILGYVIFFVLLVFLPRKLKSENQQQRQSIIANAAKRRSKILEESKRSQIETLALQKEEDEANLNDLQIDLEENVKEIEAGEQFAQQIQSRIDKSESELDHQRDRVDRLKQQYEAKQSAIDSVRDDLRSRLSTITGDDVSTLKTTLLESMINDTQLEYQRVLKDLNEELSTTAKRKSERVLSRILCRYAPDFIWPKTTGHVELPTQKIVDALSADDCTFLQDLCELSEGVEISLWQEKPEQPFVIKLGGGYGIYKEASRLTLEELIGKHPSNWARVGKVYQKHRDHLLLEARKLGYQAVQDLQVADIHPEIQTMIGALNWRTSYRQNQYFHSVEVAKLAGILAHELGVDPNMAKRCGLLHDIGKGIDYRIEGSHAVISGDYADRFGESRLICDTVMSHHNDLVLETPLSYVLKSADTLSGARPGARINLEEGYQVRLAAIDQVVKSFPGIVMLAIMNGGREVHIEVHHKKVSETMLRDLTAKIARKLEADVAFPGQIKVLVSRKFEAVTVA